MRRRSGPARRSLRPLWLWCLPSLLAAHATVAFAPSLPRRGVARVAVPPAPQPQRRSRPAPLRAVAEFEELKREKASSSSTNGRNGDSRDASASASDDGDWTPTASGGFLPNFLKERLPAGELLREVTTLPDYKRVVAEEPHRLVVVFFHAPWCRACKAVLPRVRQLARTHRGDAVKFVRVPLTPTNGFLHDGLGVPSLPFAHLYHPVAGLVEERKLNKHVLQEFQEILQDYVRGTCDVDWSSSGSPVRRTGDRIGGAPVDDEAALEDRESTLE